MNDFRDIIIKLAFTMYSSPGVYALLLGSGISRDAGIPTGWEITLDLIKNIAATEKEKPKDFEKWYQERYNDSPDYTKLLKKLTITPADRANLLRSYFKPTTEEKEDNLKVPTAAHKCIAILVKYGYIRIILTTNFDRLLEEALSEQGIIPTIISTEDEMKGAMPFVHNNCTIIKLHGDYMDTRIKNTPEELAKYPKKVDKYLDRVLEEFGLIICGWSAEYDTALRNALYRRKNRRFSTYWTVKDKLNDEATKLSNHLKAEQIPIESANKFFIQILEKVEALRDIEKPHPLTLPLAIATTKKYLSEDKYRIKLYDFVSEEAQRIYCNFSSERFVNVENNLTKETFQKRLQEYKESLAILIGILNTIIYFDKGKHSDLITMSMERLIPQNSTLQERYSFNRFPLLILTYSIGIISILRNNYKSLAALFLCSHFKDNDEKKHIIEIINSQRVFADKWIKWLPTYPDKDTPKTPISEYLHSYMREIVNAYLPDDKKYEEFFDIFEYLTGLIYLDIINKGTSIESTGSTIGRFAWKRGTPFNRERLPQSIEGFIENGLNQGDEWPLLKVGFFNGSVDRFKDCYEAYESILKEISKSWF
jgi:NAD-dependent SIR2 family protein deacetylase